MTRLNHVYRRNAIYIWRRRIPKKIRKSQEFLQVSLKTPRLSTAKQITFLVNAEFYTCIRAMESGRITHAEAQSFLAAVVTDSLQRIEEERYFEPEASTPEEWRERHLNERCRAKAAQLVASRGKAAAIILEDHKKLEADGFSPSDLTRIAGEIENLKKLASKFLGRTDCEGAHLRAVASLRLTRQAQALVLADRLDNPMPFVQLDPADIVGSLCRPEVQAPPKTKPELFNNATATPSRGDALATVIDKYTGSLDKKTDDPAEHRSLQKDLRQKRSVLSQFPESAGKIGMSDLMQSHFGAYIDALQLLPKNHGKSAADRALTLHELVERGENLPPRPSGFVQHDNQPEPLHSEWFLKIRSWPWPSVR